MFEQLTQLVQQFGQDHVVNNPAVPNEQNDAVINHASGSILDSLKNIASQEGGLSQLTGMLQNGSIDTSNPAGGVTVMLALILAPDTLKEVVEDGVP